MKETDECSPPGVLLTLFSPETEHPLFVKEPPSHISAEMEKVVDIPCQARGDCSHLPFFVFPKTYIFLSFDLCFSCATMFVKTVNKDIGGSRGGGEGGGE